MNKTRALSLELLESGRIAVSFPYNDEVISRLRALTDRKWDADKKRWEVGIGHLMELTEIFRIEPEDIDKRLYRAYQMFRIRHGRARIHANNIDASLSGVNIPMEKVDRHLSFHIPGYRFMTRFKKGVWDGKRHLFNVKKGTFPSGLAPRVARLVKEAGIDCDIIWPEESDTFQLSWDIPTHLQSKTSPRRSAPSKMTPLREYQQKCVDTALAGRRGIIEIATGGGKTLIAAHLIRQISRPTLFLVHTRDLMYQTIAVLEKELGVPIGAAGDGKLDLQSITVATIQTCARAMDIKIDQSPDDDEPLESDKTDLSATAKDLQELIKTVPVVFFDECHHLPADTAYGLAVEMTGAVWRYGLSATPYRADRQDLLMEAALGPKLFSARASNLIDLDYLVPPLIRFLPVPQYVVKNGKLDYQEVYSYCIVENRKRNKLIVDTANQLRQEGKSVLVLVSQVRHGEILSEMLGGAPLVQGADPAVDRRNVFSALCRKEIPVVIATTLADEGLDVPTLDSVILASAGRSSTRALQRVGRALRKAPGKSKAIVIDFMDNAPYLREHAADRLEIFRTEPRFELEF